MSLLFHYVYSDSIPPHLPKKQNKTPRFPITISFETSYYYDVRRSIYFGPKQKSKQKKSKDHKAPQVEYDPGIQHASK